MTFDCYLRLRPMELRALRFVHLESGVEPTDAELGGAARAEGACAIPTIEGFTEWVSTEEPAHSIGWDWLIAPPEGALSVRPHSLRTNIMLLGDDGGDKGRQSTETAILELIASWDWANAVLAAVQCASAPAAD